MSPSSSQVTGMNRTAAITPEAITPALIEAAKKEGKCAFYTAMDLEFAERLGKTFEQQIAGAATEWEARQRYSEIFQRG